MAILDLTPAPAVTVVVPCYNEERRLDAAAMAALATSGALRLLFVDDGSTDDTGLIVDRLAAENVNIAALHLVRNAGKGEAVRQGLQAARAAGADVVGYYDADLATPPAELLRLVAVMEAQPGAGVVLASRHRAGAVVSRRRVRQALSLAFNRIATRALGVQLTDTQCGAKLLRGGPALDAALDRPFGRAWSFDVVLLDRLLGRGDAVAPAGFAVEVPVDGWRDVAGSKLKPAAMASSLLQVVGLGMRRGWRRRPQGATVIDLRDARPVALPA